MRCGRDRRRVSSLDPTLFDFLGAFSLAGVCGGVGAVAGRVLAGRMAGATPPATRRRVATLGAVVGTGYPVAWIVALDAVRRVMPGVRGAPTAGGVPAVVAAGALGVVLLASVLAVEPSESDGDTRDPRGTVVLAATFAVVLPVAFAVLVRILFPVLV